VRILVVALALVVVSIIRAAPAAAQPEIGTLAVVPLDGLGADPALLQKLDGVLRAQVDRLELPAVAHDVVKAAHARSPCEQEVLCLARLGEAVGAQRVLAGSIGFAADDAHIALKVIDVASRTESNVLEERAPIDQAERRLRETALKLLSPRRYHESGSLVLSLPLAGAEVIVAGLPRGTTPLFGPIDRLTPGRREVEVRYAGLKSWRGFIDVPVDDAVRLALAVKEGAIVEVPRDDASRVPAGAAPAEPQRPLLLVGAGVAAAGVAAGVGAAISFVLAEAAFTRAHDEGDLSFVDDNEAARAAYAVLLPVGVLATAAGAGLVIFSLSE
jgi:hypothetical protein